MVFMLIVAGSALRNWTEGNFLNGTKNPAGGPAIYAANFQAITWAQQTAGYLDGQGTPNKSLAAAFDASDKKLGEFLSVLKDCKSNSWAEGFSKLETSLKVSWPPRKPFAVFEIPRHLLTRLPVNLANKLDSTLLLVGSKQGQGPINPNTLKVINPTAVQKAAGVPVAFFNGEDGGLVGYLSSIIMSAADHSFQMYLKNSKDAPTAKANLLAKSSLGISYVLAGDEIQAAGFGSPYLDPRVPDLIIGVKVGTLWNDGFEFEDHGGYLPQDLNVPLIAYNPNIQKKNVTEGVSTRQIGSTMLQALGLPVSQLKGYANGEAPVLPELF